MKIVSIHVVAFGKLKNVNLQLNSGINVLQHTNGFGKTTLASFIRAMLYGFTYTRQKGATDVSHYAPWDGAEKFGGSIVVEHEGEIYRIERFFGLTARQETLKVTNDVTGREVHWQKQPGELLLGLTADSYDRSAYFPQEAVELATNDNLESRLANLVQDGVNYDKVQDKLRAYKKNLRYERGYGGKIYELDCDKQKLSQQLAAAEASERRSVEIDRRLQQIAQEKAELTARQSECSAELQKVQQQTVAQPTQEKAQPRPTLSNKGNNILLCLGAALAVVGIIFLALGVANVLGVVAYIVGAVGVALGACGVTAYVVAYLRNKRSATVTPQNKAEQEQSQHNTRNYVDVLNELAERLSELALEAGRLTEEKKNLSFDSVAIQDKILAVEEEQKVALRRFNVADYVVKLLERAKDNLSRSYLPRLCARASQLLGEVTQSDLSVVIDRNFALSLREKGQTKPISEFSRGIREITLLCFRVALSELLYDGAIPFVIIDDAFVNFDEPNFLRATTLLKKLSASAQVIYFTCHDRTGNLLK